MDLLRHRPGRRGAVAGQDGQVLQPEMFQVVDDVMCLAPDLVRAPIAPMTSPSNATTRAV